MISVEEAKRIVWDWCRPLPPARVPLADALGRILAEPILADMDLPPFDKAVVDGFAIWSSDCATEGMHELRVGEEIPAGRTPQRPLAGGEAAVIMTGAPLPAGADAVVMHEKTRRLDGGRIAIPGPVVPGEGRIVRGREMTRGQALFPPGQFLDAIKLGVIASVGKAEVLVAPRPKVAILPTGDELVAPDQMPGPGQIRETNSTVLSGLVRTLFGDPMIHPVAPDEPEALSRAVARALANRPDVLLLCGGVSAGQRDLVPEALARNGVRTLFHKVRLKPGKPLLFGISLDPETPDAFADDPHPTDWSREGVSASRLPGGTSITRVYGLPGNPVSGIVNFLLFVAPLLHRIGHGPWSNDDRWASRLSPMTMTLAEPFTHRGDRPTYYPATVSRGELLTVTPLPWAGSSDLFAISQADGFIHFPAGDREYSIGEKVDFLFIPAVMMLRSEFKG